MDPRQIRFIVPALIIVSIFLFGLIPVSNPDFWWHLKTGEYILDNREIPDTDPFSYTAVSVDTDSPGRPRFTLQCFWLGQVVFALVVKYLGLKGFIIMRAFLFALIALIAFRIQGLQSAVHGPKAPVFDPPQADRTPNHYTQHATRSTPDVLRYALLFMLALITTECFTDRPQLFSFLFAILLVFLLERYRLHAAGHSLYAIPVLMLLWAQMHAGYVVGVVYLSVYLITLPLDEDLKRNRKVLIPLVAVSILITYFNPVGWWAFKGVLFTHGGSSFIHQDTLEYFSPLKILRSSIRNPGWLSYWALAGLSAVAMVRLFKRRSWTRLLLLAGTACASLVSMRYIYFFAALAVAFMPAAFSSGKSQVESYELQVQGDKSAKIPAPRYALHAFFMLLVLASTVAFTYHRVNFKGLLKSEIAHGFFPGRAAEHVLSTDMPQPMFNDISWGGFLIYRLWPEYKVFADTRTLNVDIYRQYMNVMMYTREGKDILRVYGVKSIITPAMNPYTGEIFPLVRALMKEDDWALVYLDGVAMIFVKKEYAHRTLPKTAIYEQVFHEVMFWSPSFPEIPGYRKTMDEVRGAFEKGVTDNGKR